MAGSVITHGKWKLPKGTVEQIKAAGLDIFSVRPDAAFDLPPVMAGERIVGDLLPEEVGTFAECNRLALQIRALRESLNDGSTPHGQGVEAEVVRLSQTWKMLHAMLHWSLGERLNLHQLRLAIRAGFRIVVTGVRDYGE